VADRIGQLIERRRAEAAVAESEARKSAVLSSALDCIITIDSARPDSGVQPGGRSARSATRRRTCSGK
jgi:hypothetical protein